jgi:hypothetical protein
MIDEALSCKCHIDQLVTKQSSACYVAENSTDDLLSCIHSVMTYVIIYGGNSLHSIKC